MSDTDLDERPATKHDTSGDLHIVSAAENSVGAMVYTALCGHAGVMWEDGTVTPETFDFFLLGHGHEQATCADCKRRTNDSATCVGCTCSDTEAA